ncbi:MAG: YeeE/YedE thiosulfate transporter family protein [Myxococcota bacterium]
MTEFTPWSALAGGMLIGLAATILRSMSGKTAGISGILGAVVRRQASWQLAFIAGMLLGGLGVLAWSPTAMAFTLDRSVPVLVAGGLLVGYGTQLGGGCTSGHGVCGISQGSSRSIVATVVFMAVAIATVAVMRAVTGGVS